MHCSLAWSTSAGPCFSFTGHDPSSFHVLGCRHAVPSTVPTIFTHSYGWLPSIKTRGACHQHSSLSLQALRASPILSNLLDVEDGLADVSAQDPAIARECQELLVWQSFYQLEGYASAIKTALSCATNSLNTCRPVANVGFACITRLMQRVAACIAAKCSIVLC